MQGIDSTQIFTDADLLDLLGISPDIGRPRESHKEPAQTEKVFQGKIEFGVTVSDQTGWVNVSMMAIPAPRPRAALVQIPGQKPRASVYNPTKYTKWKSELSDRIRFSDIRKGDYNSIDLVIGLPLKKSHRKMDKEAWLYQLHHMKPDVDNFAKGVLDAIQQSGKTGDDSIYGSALIEKVWIGEKETPFILFNLNKILSPRISFINLLQKGKKI